MSRKWAPTGSRPPAVKQTKYEWLYVIGAVCPATGQTVGMISPHIDWDALDESACEAWQKTCLDAEIIKSVCRAPYVEPGNGPREVKP